MTAVTCRVCGVAIDVGPDGRSRRRTTCSDDCKLQEGRRRKREYAARKRAAKPPTPRRPRRKPASGWNLGAYRAANAIPAIERVLTRSVENENGCWIYSGYKVPAGYGTVRVGSQTDGTARKAMTHRVTYEYFIGEIPEGLELDHYVCQEPSCCNPWHLDPCTHLVNIQRQARCQKEKVA